MKPPDVLAALTSGELNTLVEELKDQNARFFIRAFCARHTVAETEQLIHLCLEVGPLRMWRWVEEYRRDELRRLENDGT